VTIWAVVRLPHDVTLHVRPSGGGAEVQATETPTRIGRNLYLVVIRSSGVDAGSFNAGASYEYWLSSPGWPGDRTPVWNSPAFAYGGTVPTFSGPPAAVGDLRILHTSCRKPHGYGRDPIAALDVQLDAPTSRARPHLLLLTGDQIYADDVAAPLVPRIRRIAQDLVDIDEEAFFGATRIEGRQQSTLDFHLSSDAGANHLWTLSEFYAMYLLAWSDVLWPPALPTWADVDQANDLPQGHSLSEEKWNDLRGRLDTFRSGLQRVRRVLANTPTLMLFDDHEITDDWNLDHPWVTGLYANPRGRRVVTNGLLAYALFQHWGNRPDRFTTAGTPEEAVKNAITWMDPNTSPDTDPTRLALGIPTAIAPPPTQLRDLTSPNAIRYDVRITPDDGWPVQILLLDERSARGYESPAPGRGSRISSAALDVMVPAPDAAVPADTPTVVVAPAPVVGLRLVEHYLQPAAALIPGDSVAKYDVESWAAFGPTLEKLLDRLSAWKRLVILSGDVHYGYVRRLVYNKGGQQSVAAQFTASAAKNADVLTMTLHLAGDVLLRVGLERTRTFAGFRNLPAAQRNKLVSPPNGALPWDDVTDVLLGRVLRAGAEQPSVFSQEVATTYGFPAPDFTYRTEPFDDESLPTDASDLAAIQAVGGLASGGWDPAVSYQIVRGLAASDRNRIGHIFFGLPQVCWVTFNAAGTETTGEYLMAAGEEGSDRVTETVTITVPLT